MIASRTMSRQSSEGPEQAFVILSRSTGMCLTTKWRSPEAWAVVCPFGGGSYVTGAESFVDAVAGASTSRAGARPNGPDYFCSCDFPYFLGLQGIEWAILGDHSGGSMHVRTLRRRYSSSRR